MSESPGEGDGDFKTQTKYKQFSSSVERALRVFELSTEWHDLISSLARLNKVLLAYMQYPVVPHQLTVCKRLTQCLHPNLPSGVHIKTLDVYRAIFDRIKATGLTENLLVYSSGLYPLFGYASMSVRSELLDIYEKHYVALGDDLRPCVHGMVLGLLPGLEDESEHTERINCLLDSICEVTDLPCYSSALWHCVLSSPDARLPAANVLLSKLNKKLTAEDQVYLLGGNLPLVVSAICAGLVDKNVLTNRSLLDIVTILFPLHQPFLLPSDCTSIMVAALETLLKRDMSLNRRLFAWLRGTLIDKSSLDSLIKPHSLDLSTTNEQKNSASLKGSPVETVYFEAFSKKYVLSALKGLCSQAVVAVKRQSPSRVDCIQPYRLMRSLVDQTEISESVMEHVMLDIVSTLKQQVNALGGLSPNQDVGTLRLRKVHSDDLPKKLGKKGALKVEILQSANLLFNALETGFLWVWLAGLLEAAFNRLQAYGVVSGSAENLTSKEIHPNGIQQEEEKNESEDHPSKDPGEVDRNAISPTLQLSPIPTPSCQLQRSESSHSGIQTSSQRHNAKDLKSCTSIVGLTKFLLQSLPLDSIENAHLLHIPQLCLTMVTALHKTHPFLTAHEIQLTLDLISCIIHELMKSPSSRASTPSTPFSATPSKTGRVMIPYVSESSHSNDTSSGENAESADSSTKLEVKDILFPPPLEKIVYDIIEVYREFLSGFINERVLLQESNKERQSKNVATSLSKACQLLLLLAAFGTEKDGPIVDPQEREPNKETPTWLTRLVSACTLDWMSHDHHVTYVAMDTLLKILRMHREQVYSTGFPSDGVKRSQLLGGLSCTKLLITDAVYNYVASNHNFVRTAADCLWSCLSPSQPSCHVEAAALLSWLHIQLTPSTICETVILEHFSSEGLTAYHSFAALWQHSPSPGRTFNRAILRTLEGLKSDSPSVRLFVQSWVNFALSREEDLQKLLQPLLRILLTPNTFRRSALGLESNQLYIGMGLSPEDAERDPAYAKYYYASLGIPDPRDASKRGQYRENLFHYSQLFDTEQVLYALSLLQCVIEVDPPSVISSMSSVLVDPLSYGGSHARGTKETTDSSEHILREAPSLAQKSLFELTLSSTMDLLRSDYPANLEASLSSHLDNINVKIASAELVYSLLTHLTKTLASSRVCQATEGEASTIGRRKINSSSFVSALVTLCDVQKITLLTLGQVVRDLRDVHQCLVSLPNETNASDNSLWTSLLQPGPLNSVSEGAETLCLDPQAALQSLFTHLLMIVQGLVAMETQCQCKQASAITPTQPTTSSTSSGLSTSCDVLLPAVLTSVPTATQPFFQVLLLDLLSDHASAHLHEILLNLFSSILPNLLNQQLYELAPKVLKQLCKNLEIAPQKKEKSVDSQTEPSSSCVDISRKLSVLYLDSLCAIIVWCLYGESQPPLCEGSKSGHKYHQSMNPYWRRLQVVEVEEQSEPLSPNSRQPSTMSWLFSVFTASAQGSKSLAINDGSTSKQNYFSRSRIGINSRVGQYTLMLLPAVYNAIIEVWRQCCHSLGSESTGRGRSGYEVDVGEVSSSRKTKMESEDIYHLISQLFLNLAKQEPTAFFSSISHVWMEWNLEMKVQSSRRLAKRKEIFIDLLHKIKVLPLSGVIECVQSTLSDIALVEDKDSSLLRQKYLLHFLYKYISGTQQGSEELASCSGQVVSFLRDFYSQSFSNTPDYLINNCHILCMLTSILHVVVCRVPAPEPKKQKKERKELQDLIHKLCESLSMAANVGLPNSDYILVEENIQQLGSGGSQEELVSMRTSSEVVEGEAMTSAVEPPTTLTDSGRLVHGPAPAADTKPSLRSGSNRMESPLHVGNRTLLREESTHHSDSEVATRRDKGLTIATTSVPQSLSLSSKVNKSEVNKTGAKHERTASQDLKLPTVQALAVLSNVLSHFVDCAFEGPEKDKVVALLKAVMHNVWPHLQNHSPESQQNYAHAVKLLSSLSGFQVSRKAWRKEALDLFLSPTFFEMKAESLHEWKIVVDNLMTQDHVTFRDLLSRVHTSTTSGVVNIFSSIEQEVLNGARLLKRMAFAILSAETDQFVEFLPDIQERLSDYLRVLRYPPVCAVVMLAFRVLLVRFSSVHLMAFWPAITSEMFTMLRQLDKELCTVVSEGSTLSVAKLQLHLSVCKLLDTAMALPTEHLPHFQLLRWGFTDHGAYSDSNGFVISKLCKHFQSLGSPTLGALHAHYSPHPTTSPPYLQSTSISSLRELKPLFAALSGQSKGVGHFAGRKSEVTGSHFSLVREQEKRWELVEEIILQDFVELTVPS